MCVGVGVLLVGGVASGLHGLSLVLDGGAETVYGWYFKAASWCSCVAAWLAWGFKKKNVSLCFHFDYWYYWLII